MKGRKRKGKETVNKGEMGLGIVSVEIVVAVRAVSTFSTQAIFPESAGY